MNWYGVVAKGNDFNVGGKAVRGSGQWVMHVGTESECAERLRKCQQEKARLQDRVRTESLMISEHAILNTTYSVRPVRVTVL